jgi:hypothetical protein
MASQPWTSSSPSLPCDVPDAGRRPSNTLHSRRCHSLLGSAPVSHLDHSHPSSHQPSKWGPGYLPPSAACVQIHGNFHPKLPSAMLCTNTNGIDCNPEGPTGDNDHAQNDDRVQTPRVKCKVPYVGNPDNANCCDAQGLRSNFYRHSLTILIMQIIVMHRGSDQILIGIP